MSPMPFYNVKTFQLQTANLHYSHISTHISAFISHTVRKLFEFYHKTKRIKRVRENWNLHYLSRVIKTVLRYKSNYHKE